MPSQLTDEAIAVCPCCGSDASRLELYLDNGFGFSLIEDESYEFTLVAVESDPSEDFHAFYLEQLRHLFELSKLTTNEEWDRWMSAIQAAFAGGIEHAARQHGAELTAADVVVDIIEAEIACRLMFDRLGAGTSPTDASAELKRALEQGFSAEEAGFVGDVREKLAGTLERGEHQLGRDVAQRLRRSLWGGATASSRQALRPQRSARGPRSQRRASSARCRSPGREDPPDEPDDDVARRGGLLRVLGGRR